MSLGARKSVITLLAGEEGEEREQEGARWKVMISVIISGERWLGVGGYRDGG